jgi:hypothetical protein
VFVKICTCDHCGKECRTVEIHETEVSEAWGAREVRTVIYLASDCCSESVTEQVECEDCEDGEQDSGRDWPPTTTCTTCHGKQYHPAGAP